jgi:hypothetical protein
MKRRRLWWLAAPILVFGVLFGVAAVFPSMREAQSQVPRYVNGNELARPRGYRRWIFVGASLGLTYAPTVASGAASARVPARHEQMFHHTYLAPGAYDEYLRTGEFPDKTILVLELYAAGEKTAPATGGLFEAERHAVEVAVKDRERFPDRGWAYFSFGEGPAETAFPSSARCVACHREHAAHDNVFTQFYPVLRDRPQSASD